MFGSLLRRTAGLFSSSRRSARVSAAPRATFGSDISAASALDDGFAPTRLISDPSSPGMASESRAPSEPVISSRLEWRARDLARSRRIVEPLSPAMMGPMPDASDSSRRDPASPPSMPRQSFQLPPLQDDEATRLVPRGSGVASFASADQGLDRLAEDVPASAASVPYDATVLVSTRSRPAQFDAAR